MPLNHQLITADARSKLELEPVHLVVTSPPYPMIAMWDEPFSSMDPAVGRALAEERGMDAWRLMHGALDDVWRRCFEALVDGGIACINIGDATRSLGGEFARYPNAARVTSGMIEAGFTPLPDIIWRKPTNAPNKFMGSGMLPAGAYVTYEHEYILIFRKGGKRTFKSQEQRELRRKSAFFWEERNRWFSDIWSDISGTLQLMEGGGARERSAAFPMEIPTRLVLMYSLKGERVLDPFAGTGTTLAAAAATGREGVGIEVEPGLREAVERSLEAAPTYGERLRARRLREHKDFVEQREAAKGPLKHFNEGLGVPVVTGQEVLLEL